MLFFIANFIPAKPIQRSSLDRLIWAVPLFVAFGALSDEMF